jgi:hypothetical protein
LGVIAIGSVLFLLADFDIVTIESTRTEDE